MPSALNISSYHTLSALDVDRDSDYLIVCNNDNPVSSTKLYNFLDQSTVKKDPYYFVDSFNLSIDPKKSQSNFFSHINKSGLLGENSQINGRIDVLLNSGSASLPSLYLYKNYGNSYFTLTNFENSVVIDVAEEANILVSRILYNNSYYNLRCKISSSQDALMFDYFGFSREEVFDVRINVVIESYV